MEYPNEDLDSQVSILATLDEIFLYELKDNDGRYYAIAHDNTKSLVGITWVDSVFGAFVEKLNAPRKCPNCETLVLPG